MNVKSVAIFISALAISAAFVDIVASPAATQNWVKDYVATNQTTSSATKSWVEEYVATNQTTVSYIASSSTNTEINVSKMGMTACQILLDGGSNSVQRAIDSVNAEADAIVDSIFNSTIGF